MPCLRQRSRSPPWAGDPTLPSAAARLQHSRQLHGGCSGKRPLPGAHHSDRQGIGGNRGMQGELEIEPGASWSRAPSAEHRQAGRRTGPGRGGQRDQVWASGGKKCYCLS